MNALVEDISKIVSLLEYQSEVYRTREVPITQKVLDKFGISEEDFTVALRRLLAKRPEVKIKYEHIDGDPHPGPEGEIEFYKIEIGDRITSENKKDDEELFSGPAVPEKTAGSLAIYSDGSIRVGGVPVRLRAQLRDLCARFLSSPETVLNADDLRDIASLRNLDLKTVAKYVSELRKVLETETGRNVLVHKGPGWCLEIDS